MPTKKELEILLSKLDRTGNKKSNLQQYDTPSNIASDLIWIAFMQGDLKIVADFGTGNGILAIGAKLLGAEKVYAIETDKKAMEIARKNAKGLDIIFVNKDISEFNKKVHTVVMNPPFGKKPKHIDRYFLLKGFEISQKIYSIHTANSYEFLSQFSRKNNFVCKKLKEFEFPLRRSFKWHEKPVKSFKAVMLMFAHKSLKKEK